MFERRFTIEITDRPDALGRILVLCQQRRCQVTALSYVGADRHRRAQLSLAVRAPSWSLDRLPRWLCGLVDVLEVRESGAAPARWCPTGADRGIDGRDDLSFRGNPFAPVTEAGASVVIGGHPCT